MAGFGKLLVSSLLVVCALGASIDSKDDRIIGGVQIPISEAPYQLAFYTSFAVLWYTFQCGAVIISPEVALTAAHCTVLTTPRRVYLRAGSANRHRGGTTHYLRTFVNHPDYTIRDVSNDISILFMTEPIVMNSETSAIALPRIGFYPDAGTSALVSGWGTVTSGGLSEGFLRGAYVPIVSLDQCKELYSSYRIQVADDMLCAGFVGVGNIDACQGDSGGPLAADGLLVGVVSWGNGCALANFPGVYANVAYFRNWIFQNSGV